jgi:hypothetical protein
MSLKVTRAILDAIHSGELTHAQYKKVRLDSKA